MNKIDQNDIKKALIHQQKKLIKQGDEEEVEIITEEIKRLDNLLSDHF